MAIKFALRGNAITAYMHSGSGKTPLIYDVNAGGAPTVVSHAPAIGGQAINYDGGGLVKGHIFPGFDNVSKTGIISVLARVAPTYSGSPSSNSAIFSVMGPKITSVVAQLFEIVHLTTGNLVLSLTSPSGSTSQNNTVLGAWSPTAGQYYDIVVTWTGTTAANGIKVYIDGTLFAQLTASVTWAAGNLQSNINLGLAQNSIITSLLKLNEFVLWDSVIDPTSGGLNLNGSARAAFVTVSGVLDPTNSVGAGAANIRSGTSETINGVQVTGTAAIPTAAQVLSGVSVDATVGNVVLPAAGNVRSGTAYGPASGNTGTAAIPTAAQVLSGVSVDATVGTVNLPDVAEVLDGVLFGAADALTGTLIRNSLVQATLIGQAPPAATATTLVATQGDSVVFNFKALLGPALGAHDLTGAVCTAYLLGPNGEVSFDDTHFVIDPDQVTNKGMFTLALSSAEMDTVGVGARKEVVVKAVQGSSVIYFHGTAVVTVVSKTPAV